MRSIVRLAGGFARSGAAPLACLLFLASGVPLQAQQTGTVTGRIVDGSTQRPLAGAQVTVVGAGLGVLARADGTFTISGVPAGEATIRAQLLGYQQAEQEVAVAGGETVTVDFELSVSALALDEIVVTGVGQATQRRELATSVSVLGSEAIETAPVQTVDQLLQGRVAGAQVSNVSAQPGTASVMSFRGVSSVFGSQTPVIYVDGVRVDNRISTAAGTGGEQSSALAELLTADIERIEITRGGAASTLYGSDAATGVIQIFTKRGTPGAPRITARAELGFDNPELKYLLDAGMIYPQFVWEDDPGFDPDQPRIPADFVEREFFKNGAVQSYSLNARGGHAEITYSLSGRVEQGDGIQPKNDHELYNLRGRLDAEVADRVRTHFSAGITRSNFNRIFSGTFIADPLTALEVGDVMFFAGLGTRAENLEPALEIFLLPDIGEEVNRFQFSTGLTFEHSRYFSARVTGGVDHRGSQQRQFQPIGFTPGDEEGSLNRRDRTFSAVSLDAAATVSYPVEGDFTLRSTLGVQGFREDVSVSNAFGRGAIPGSQDFGEMADITAFEDNQEVFTGGVFVDEQIGLWSRLFVNLGLRVDGSTAFGDEVDFELYPKAGATYSLGQAHFFQDRFGDWWNELQLRMAYGETGKFPPPFLRDRIFSSISFRGEGAPRFDNPGEPDLAPEVTETFEVGFETALANDRLGVDFTWFHATTADALFFVPEQPVTGFGTQIRNVGEIRNSGVEVDVSLLAMNRPGFRWHLGATLQTVDNVVNDMGGVPEFSVGAGGQQRVTEGRPVGTWWVTTPYDASGDGNLDSSRPDFAGTHPYPDQSGSVSTRLTIAENLQVSLLADWARGHEVFDWGSVWATFNGILRREIVDCPPVVSPEDCEPSRPFPRRHDPDTGEELGPFGQSSARSAFLEPGDFIKLREVSVRYNLPSAWSARLGAEQGTVYGSVRNAWIWSRSDLVDPELAGISDAPSGGLLSEGLVLGGQQSITMPAPRAFRFGLEFVF